MRLMNKKKKNPLDSKVLDEMFDKNSYFLACNTRAFIETYSDFRIVSTTPVRMRPFLQQEKVHTIDLPSNEMTAVNINLSDT